MPSTRDERLADVYARAARLRSARRGRVGVAALAACVVALGVVVAVVADRGSGDEVRVAAGGAAPEEAEDTEAAEAEQDEATTTSVYDPALPTITGPSTSVPPTPPPPTGVPPSTAAPSSTIVPSTTTPPTATTPPPGLSPPNNAPPLAPTAPAAPPSTTPPCRNSAEERCGEFRYDPEPVNEPMVVRMGARPATEAWAAGSEVVFEVLASDDGPLMAGDCTNSQVFGDASPTSLCTADCAPTPPRYGPWDPPPREESSISEVFRHVYEEPGTYVAVFAYNVGSGCSGSPYLSTGEVRTTVIVR